MVFIAPSAKRTWREESGLELCRRPLDTALEPVEPRRANSSKENLSGGFGADVVVPIAAWCNRDFLAWSFSPPESELAEVALYEICEAALIVRESVES
jgi:hypothetical protein